MRKINLTFLLFFLLFLVIVGLIYHTYHPYSFLTQEAASPNLPSLQSENQPPSELRNPPPSDRDTLLSSMHLTFSDEFDTLRTYTDTNGHTTCNPGGIGIWQTVYHFCSRTNPANLEAELYTDENFLSFLKNTSKEAALTDNEYPFVLRDGILKIQAKPSSMLIQKKAGPWAKYSSGMLTTQFSFSQMYGYFEIRTKLPKGKGLWPAFWLLPIDKTWPPEVDVFESFGGKNPKGYGGTYKIYTASHSNKPGESCGDWHDMGTDLSQDFHTFGADVEPDKITFYFDGKIHTTCKPNFETNKPFYMVVNLAVGGPGSWPAEPDTTNAWPAELEVDYIKAYQKN